MRLLYSVYGDKNVNKDALQSIRKPFWWSSYKETVTWMFV